MGKDYVERRDGGLYIAGTRVPVDRVVWEFQRGEPAEAIRSHYSTLDLEEVYGAIAFYLGNKEEVEAAMAERLREEEEWRKANPTPPGLKAKLERRRRELQAQKS